MRKGRLFIIMICCASSAAQAKGAFETYGDVGQFAIPAVAAGISWYKGDNEGLEQFGYSILATTATVELLKNTVDATRPNGGDKSFPSGHTALAFSGASYLQRRYGWDYGLPAYLAAGAVGWSRVTSDNHYWRDVIAGAAIATGFTYLFTSPRGTQLAFYPLQMDGDARGIGVSLNY